MNPSPLRSLWERLKDERAFQIGTVYAGASWFVVQAADTLGGSASVVRTLAATLAAGFVLLVAGLWLWERRRERRPDGAAAPARPGPALRRRWAVAVGGFCALAIGAWWAGFGRGAAPVPDAATRLAVLPFHVTGSAGLQELSIGMVDLLSPALDDVGGIRTVSGRTVLARAELGRGGDGLAEPLGLDGALEVGRSVGAGSVLMGSLTGAGGRVRINGEIRSTATGEVLASTDVEGPESDVLALTDELAVGLLRELWRSEQPLPTVRTAALTTTSPAALRAYLRGERHLRAMRMDSASLAFERATREDSTFALAWLRLSESEGWQLTGSGELDPTRRRHTVEQASRFGERLPERERTLLRAVALKLDGAMAVMDSLDGYVRRYPDDPYGWFLLGDARFHAAHLGLHGEREIVEPFLEATRLDPTFALGLTHAVDLALDRGDREEFDRLMASYAPAVPAEAAESLRRQARVRWAPTDSLVDVFLREAGALHPVQQRIELNALVGVLGNRTRLDPTVDPMAYVDALEASRDLFPGDRRWQLRMAELVGLNLFALGRAEAAIAATERFLDMAPPGVPPLPRAQQRAFFLTMEALSGNIPLERVRDEVRRLEEAEVPFLGELLHVFHLKAGDPDRAARYPAPRVGGPGPDVPADTVGARLALEGMIALTQGDSTRALALIDEGVQRLGYISAGPGGFMLDYAEILATRPERRDQGIRMLRWSTVYHATDTGRAFLGLGRALEAAGEVEEARRAYGHVVRLWEGAEPYRQGAVAEARRALVRLTAE